ncbi:imidazole glycerol phosphate synthase subunit HisH [Aeromicrobium sp.]|uniref:imidazole glycerol phosphate synthase subunit HisH n=1 Tax=Aeromicrobium sp. TaxID=1871063 RepID=UPI0019980CE6|nr:imidazole glycerol phosphate synthase subunit HisH [Aeromicrobium sp.]MBC7632744.1 imidazole glycerol phosphate synthase subunit HisH [Aeromicrobium sp.]
MTRPPRVAVLDYGSGNLRSAVRAVERAGAQAELTSDAGVALEAEGLLVPGVGAFEACMKGLLGIGGMRIIEKRLIAGRPVLGICVGMQILFGEGIEHGVRTEGCAELPGVVERLHAPIVPHMGWNTVEAGAGSRMFAGIEDQRFYFVHSYGVREWVLSQPPAFPDPAVTWTEYAGDRFVSAVEHGPLWATQFHPEKSGDAGSALLQNWLATL